LNADKDQYLWANTIEAQDNSDIPESHPVQGLLHTAAIIQGLLQDLRKKVRSQNI
jgi:hypothetical protein